jgi:hypothetical protein
MKSTKPKKGWPQRERASIALKVAPSVADWYADYATKKGRSRNQLMELVLEAVRDSITDAEQWERDNDPPLDVTEAFKTNLVGKLLNVGIASDVILRADEERRSTNERLLREIGSDKKRGGR